MNKIEYKYNIGNTVFIMLDNKPVESEIDWINIMINTTNQLVIQYGVLPLGNNSFIIYKKFEREIFSTKIELLESL